MYAAARESLAVGSGRLAVRGLRASISASTMRLKVMAVLRADTMQTRMRKSWPRCGQPRPWISLSAERKVAIMREGQGEDGVRELHHLGPGADVLNRCAH